MPTASDDFETAGALTDPPWTMNEGGLSRSGGLLQGSSGSYNMAFRNDIAGINADQWSRIICGTYGADGYEVVSVRCSGTPSAPWGYRWTFSAVANNADLIRFRGSTTGVKIQDLAEQFGIPAEGQAAELRVVGTVVTAYIGATPIFSVDDGPSGLSIPSGDPGCGLFRTSSRIASWEGGDFVVAGGGSLLIPRRRIARFTHF